MALGYLISPALQIAGTNGKPLTGGTLRVTLHGTSTPYITYKDFTGDLNPADVVLDAKGMAVLIADDGNLYDIYCKDMNGVDQWSRLNVCTIGSGSGGGGEYVGGTGIVISGDTINVDTSAIQPILSAGDNISIIENRISAADTTYTATEPVVIDGTDIQLHVGAGLSVTSDGLSVDTSAIQTVLTFTDGLTNSAGVVSIDNPTPPPSGSDSGKVLSVVDSSGTLGWVSQPTFTQQNADWTATDGVQEIINKPDEKPMVAGSGIIITESASDIAISALDQLPSITGNAGKALQVNNGATGVEWVTPSASLFEAVYNTTSYATITAAITAKKIVYCRVSASDPTRMAFLAYVGTDSVEFQYYRSVSSHTDTDQGDEVYVYKVTSANVWTTTTRKAYTKVIAGTGLSSSFTTGTSSSITLSLDKTVDILTHSESVTIQGGQFVNPETYSLNKYIAVGQKFYGTLSIQVLYSTLAGAYHFELGTNSNTLTCNFGDYTAARQSGHVIPVYVDNTNGSAPVQLFFTLAGQFEAQTLSVKVQGITIG